MKKYLICLVLVLASVLSLSCEKKDEPDNTVSTVADASDNASDTYKMGVTEDGVYVNELAGVCYNIPQKLEVLSLKDMYMATGMTAQDIENPEKFKPESLDIVYELYGTSADGGMVIINTFKNTDVLSKITEMKSEFDGKTNDILKPSYADETAVTYGGVNFTRFDVTASAPEFVMYQTYLFKNIDEHLFCISVAAPSEEMVEELLGGVSCIK